MSDTGGYLFPWALTTAISRWGSGIRTICLTVTVASKPCLKCSLNLVKDRMQETMVLLCFTVQILLWSHWIFHWINSAVCNGSTCLKNTPKWRESPHSINIPEGLAPHFPSASNILRTGVEQNAKNPQTTRTVEHLEIVGEAKSNSWGDNRLPRAIIPKELHIQAY